MEPDFTPDTAPLADALADIAKLIDASESDPDMLFDLVVAVRDRAQDGLSGWGANKSAALKAEADYLRARVASR